MDESEKVQFTAITARAGDKIKFVAKIKELKRKNPKAEPIVEDKILIIGNFKILLLKPGKEVKLETSNHIVELTEICCSASCSELTLKFKSSNVILLHGKSENLTIVNEIRKCWISNFPNIPSEKCFTLTLPDGIALEQASALIGSCGGFVRTYKCISSLHGTEVSRDVCWDINNLFENNNHRTFRLAEFILPSSLAVKAMIEALRYNSWFDSLVVTQPSEAHKIQPFVATAAGEMMQDNRFIKTLVISGVGNAASFQSIAKPLSSNKVVLDIDFSTSELEDKGAVSLANECLAVMDHGLRSINLSDCSISKTGLNALFKALLKNEGMLKTLEELKISRNKLGTDVADLCAFLDKTSSLQKLEIAGMGIKVSALAEKYPTCSTLVSLDISDNSFQVSKKEQPPLKLLLANTPNLTELNISKTETTADILQISLIHASKLKTLYLNNNEFTDEDFGKFVDSLVGGLLPNLNSLSLNGCLTGKKKNLMVEKISTLISSSSYAKCPLTSLFIAADPKESKTQLRRDDILPFIFDLLTNETITEIDVSHHWVGDSLAIALAKVLQTNITLQKLSWDGNGTTPSGFKKFKHALEKNNTLRSMPMPILDISNVTKNIVRDRYLPTVWTDILTQIQEKISENAGQKKEKIRSAARQIMKRMISVISHDWKRIDESYNIPITQLNDHLTKLKESEGSNILGINGFDLEFNFINQETATETRSAYKSALKPENQPKNRYPDVLPFETTRFVLQDVVPGGNDYINANWIDGFVPEAKKQYIACQGPNAACLADFWLMVWESNANVIVMLTREIENGRVKCDKYWPDYDFSYVSRGATPQNIEKQFSSSSTKRSNISQTGTLPGQKEKSPLPTMEIEPFTVRLIKIVEETPDITVRTLDLINNRNGQIKSITHFQYTEWPDHGLPKNQEGFLSLLEQVEKISKGPIIVHCSAGVGRSGVFCTVHGMVKKLESEMKSRTDVEPIINMVEAVLHLRKYRKAMVQTKEQYEFCYLVFNTRLQYVLGNIKRAPPKEAPKEAPKGEAQTQPVPSRIRKTRKIDPKRASHIYEKVDLSQETAAE